jgi:predicted dehydrogenase
MDEQKHITTRRGFMIAAGAAGAATFAATHFNIARAQNLNSRLGVGVIGCGGRGRHLVRDTGRLRAEGEAFDYVAVCDVYRPRMAALAEQAGAEAQFMDHRELLAHPGVDVAIIATPDHLHGYQAIDAAKAGKHMYCEKPFTHWRQIDLTIDAMRAVQESGVKFQLGTQGLSDDAWTMMKERVEAGLIGQPIVAECGYFRVGDWGERGMNIDDPDAQPGPDLNWEAFLGDAPKRDFDVSRFFRWRMYEDYSGGPATDLFPHSLTPVAYILGTGFPKLAMGTGGKYRYEEREVPDTFNMLADYPEKCTIAVLGTQANEYQGTGYRGSGGRIPVIRGWEGTLTVVDNEVRFMNVEGGKKPDQAWKIEQGESVMRHFKDLLDGIRNGGTPRSNVEMAAQVQVAFQMATYTMRTGKVATWDAEAQKVITG